MSEYPSEAARRSIHFFMDGCNGHCDQYPTIGNYVEPSQPVEEKHPRLRGFPAQDSHNEAVAQLDLEQSHAKVHALWQGSTDLSIQKASAASHFIDTMTKLDSGKLHPRTLTQDTTQSGTNLYIHTAREATQFIDHMAKLDRGEETVNRGTHAEHRSTPQDLLPNLSLHITREATKFMDSMIKLDSPVQRTRRASLGKTRNSPGQKTRHVSTTLESSQQPTNLSIQKAHDASKFIENMSKLDNGEHVGHQRTQQSADNTQLPNLSLQKTQDGTSFLDQMERLQINVNV